MTVAEIDTKRKVHRFTIDLPRIKGTRQERSEAARMNECERSEDRQNRSEKSESAIFHEKRDSLVNRICPLTWKIGKPWSSFGL